MRKDKDDAIKLRRNGYSYNQISQKMTIPKSTLSTWLKDVSLSQLAQEKIHKRVHDTSVKALIKRNRQQTQKSQEEHQKIRDFAALQYHKYTKDPLFIAGVAMYWSEGYKKGAYGSKWKSIDFANSDPAMITIMIRFFEKFLHITKENMKIQIIAHKNVDAEKSMDYWHKITKIPLKNFMKVSHVKNNSKNTRAKNTIPHGTIHVRITNVRLFFELIGWIDEMKKTI
ncbi:MAG: hypothetical protein WC819_03760 [Parcubacteria group bacterium]